MSKYFSFCNQRNSRASSGQQKKKTVSKQALAHKVCLGLSLRVFLVLIIVVLVGGYVFLINFGSTKGFEMAKIEQDIKILQEQNKSLSDNVQELKSLANIEKRAEGLGMVSVGGVEYFSVIGEVAVAK